MTLRPFAGLTCEEVLDLVPGFVLGALGEEEMAAVRAHLATCPEAHEEMDELGGVVPYLAQSLDPVEPPPGLRARILAAAEADRHADAPSAEPAPFRVRGTIDRTPWRRPRLYLALSAAAVFAIAIVGAGNLALQRQVSDLAAYRQGVSDVLDAVAAPGSQLAILTAGDAFGPRGLAALRTDGSVVLAMRDLAPTTGTQVYETWVIAGQGPPVPLGGFTVGADGTATFLSHAGPVAPGAIVALTLELGPGATTPTLPIVAKGVASPPPA